MDQSLNSILTDRYGVVIDPTSDSGQLLSVLKTDPVILGTGLAGDTAVGPLTLVPSERGISVRGATGQDALVLSLPPLSRRFLITAPAGPGTMPSVAVTLLTFTIPLPFLQGAQLNAATGLLERAPAPKVELSFNNLDLVIPSNAAPHLAPSPSVGGGFSIEMTPAFAFFGNDTTLGFHLPSLELNPDAPGGSEIRAKALEIFVNPPGVPALAMSGGGRDLVLGLEAGNGGLSGVFSFSFSPGTAGARPDFLQALSCQLELQRGTVTLFELRGQIDFEKAVNGKFPGQQLDNPAAAGASYLLSLHFEQEEFVARLALTGTNGYLWRTERSGTARNVARDILGGYAVFGPLLANTVPPVGGNGLVDLAIIAGTAASFAALRVVQTVSITLFGGELMLKKAGTTTEAFLFFDLEVVLDVTALPLIETARPIKVRHQALGLKLEFGGPGAGPTFKPFFDPSRGFSLDLSDPGMFRIPNEALASILQPTAARAHRENPLHLEVDLSIKADLGVVSVDKATVRIPINPVGPPEITALGIHVNVPGGIEGSGYLSIQENQIVGTVDAELSALHLRASAQIAMAKLPGPAPGTFLDETAVAMSFEVGFPIPIALLNSGLGIFGFAGLFAMHYRRNQKPPATALDWLRTVNGNAGDLKLGWEPAAGQWALGFGALIGTMEGGFIAHAKGMLILELPGPELLFVMKANVLKPPPAAPIKGNSEANFLAIIALNLRDNTLTIGLIVEYDIDPIFELRVPAEVFFDANDTSDWHLNIGGIPGAPGAQPPASIKFLSVIKAEGYLLINGKEILGFPLPPKTLPGLALALGLHVDLIWGPEPIGLYLKISAGVDAALTFKPFMAVGRIEIGGELHLFVVSIGAHAMAIVRFSDAGFYAKLTVEGSIDCWLFEISGSVTFEIGDPDLPAPPADPLVRALSLHSRSPALMPGSGANAPIDGSLGEAVEAGRPPPAPAVPVVPLDAIPVLQFEMGPQIARATPGPGLLTVLGTEIRAVPGAAEWGRRGNRFFRYEITAISLTGVDGANVPLPQPTTAGDTPNTWWTRHGGGYQGDADAVQLALLSWIPDATPTAATRRLDEKNPIVDRWQDLCVPIAEPTAVLWTFHATPLGPSLTPWSLTGRAWADLPDTKRSAPPILLLTVTEPWRSGNPIVDGVRRVAPASVRLENNHPSAGRFLVASHTGERLLPSAAGPEFQKIFDGLGPHVLHGLPDGLRLGTSFTAIRLLLAMDTKTLKDGAIVLRALGASGLPIGPDTEIDSARGKLVTDLTGLPARWSDPAPQPGWRELVEPAFHSVQSFEGMFGADPARVFFEMKLPPGTEQIEIGVPRSDSRQAPTWALLAVEATTASEVQRVRNEERDRETEKTLLDGALSAPQGKRALLRPGATYTAKVEYTVQSADADEQGARGEPGKAESATQSFVFQTDTKPPASLDPWVLTSHPALAEDFFFWGEPYRLVLSSDAVQPLFEAYQCELFALLSASSGHDPQAGPGFDGAEVSLFQASTPAVPVQSTVLTPWHETMVEVLKNLPCVALSGTLPQPQGLTLNYELHPLTNYVFDIIVKPAPAAPAKNPFFRRHFSTSRYENMPALAAAVHAAPVGHRSLRAGVLGPALTALPASLTDADLDALLRALRWGELGRIVEPRVSVLWEGATPEPVAVLLETPEPLWRWRQVPQKDGTDPARPRFTLQRKEWIEAVDTSAVVSRFLFTVTGGRALAVLKPGARGSSLSLRLRQTPHEYFEKLGDPIQIANLLDLSLAGAPWEETL